MNSSNPPYRHHYIPKFYLRRWAGPDGKICQFSRPHRVVVPLRCHPAATGYLDRAYELQGFAPLLAQQVETEFFKPVDSWASDALMNLEAHGHHAQWDSHLRS